MSSKLFEQLYEQISLVVSRPIALADDRGQLYGEYSSLKSLKHVRYIGAFTPEIRTLAVEEDKTLQALPIYLDSDQTAGAHSGRLATNQPKLLVVVLVKISADDTQTVQIINSLAELIVQQFILAHQPKPDAIDLLLTRLAFRPQTLDPEELSEQMTALGFRLDLPRAAVAIELQGFRDNYLQSLGSPRDEKESLIEAKKREINQSLISFFTKDQDNLVGFIGNDTFLILKDLRDSDYQRFSSLLNRHYQDITAPLKNIHIQNVTIGVGSAATTPSGLMRSAGEALQVLKIGQKVVGSNRTYRLDSLGVLPLLLMSNDAQKKEFANKLFGSLEDAQLTETLEAFIAADLNLTQAATKLKIHRNTVIYRLDRIQEKLGKDPRRFTDAVELYLASLFTKLFQ